MKRTILIFSLLFACFSAFAQTEVRFGDEAADTLRLTRLLDDGAARRFALPEDRVAFFARQFIGTPYGAHTLDVSPEMLTVRLDSLDCMTFVETCMALAYTVGEHRMSWRDFVYNLRRIRYRGGEVDGYPSRLHYVCDWAVDNQHRGNFSDVTRNFPRHNEILRTIDFMSTHRNAYPALADSADFARIRSIEGGYRQHRFPYIKTIDLGNKAVKEAFHDGDVVGFVSNLKDLDVTHMGIVVKDTSTSEPHILHASMTNGKVEISAQPMAAFVKRNRQWLGVRVFRLNE